MRKKKKEEVKEEKKTYYVSLELIVESKNNADPVEIFKQCIHHGKYTDDDIAIIFDNRFAGMFEERKDLDGKRNI